MVVENTEISARKKDIKPEDRAIVDAFKQVLLLSGPPAVAPCQGHAPMWQKAPGQAWILAEFETFNGKCYMLPIAGPECSLRGILTVIKKEGRHDKRPEHSAIFAALTEGRLVQVLKDFSLIIYTEPDDKAWIRKGDDGQKIVALRREQLAPYGRLGRVPLPALVEQYAGHIFRHGIALGFHSADLADYELQLLKEHHIKRGLIDELAAWIMARRELYASKKRGKLTADEIKEAVALIDNKGGK